MCNARVVPHVLPNFPGNAYEMKQHLFLISSTPKSAWRMLDKTSLLLGKTIE